MVTNIARVGNVRDEALFRSIRTLGNTAWMCTDMYFVRMPAEACLFVCIFMLICVRMRVCLEVRSAVSPRVLFSRKTQFVAKNDEDASLDALRLAVDFECSSLRGAEPASTVKAREMQGQIPGWLRA